MKSLLHSLGLLLLLSVGYPLCLQAQSSLTAIGEMIEREQYDLAEQALLAVIEQEPKHARAYYWLGMIFLERGEEYVAESYFRQGIKARKREALNHVGLGQVLFAKKNIKRGRESLEKALAIAKGNTGILLLIAEIYLEEGGPESLRESEALLVRASPAGCSDYVPLICDYNGQNQQLYDFYKRSIEGDPSCVFPYVRLAEMLISQSRLTEAKQYLEMAMKLDPGFAPTHLYLGEIKGETDPVAQQQYYAKYYQLVGNDRRAATIYAKLLFSLKEYEKAVAVLTELNKQDEQSLKLLIASLVFLENYQAAHVAYNKYLLVSTERRFRNGWIIEGMGIDRETGEIHFFYTEDNERTPDTLEILNAMVDIARSDEDYAWEAFFRKRLIEKMAQPTIRDYYYLGTAQYRAGQFHEADSSFGQVIAIQPDFSVAHFWRVRIAQKFDPDHAQWLVLPHAQRVVELLGDKAIGELKPAEKTQLATCYQLMVAYHYAEQPDGTGNCEAARPWLAKARELGEKREWIQQIQTQCDP